MSILADWKIAQYAKKGMIQPFVDRQIRDNGLANDFKRKVISYGLSSYGYDVRVGDRFQIFTPVGTKLVDPKNFDPSNVVEYVGKECIIPPNSFALAETVEYFEIPKNVLTVCVGKSTYARCGIIVNVTPFEPGWKGVATLEISNTTPIPAKIYAGEGIAQVLFFENEYIPEVTYDKRQGKYQDQKGIVLPKV